MANFRLNNRHLPVFLTVGVCHVSNNSSLCFQTLQDLKSNKKREKWESIFFESKMCLSSLQVNVSALWACTFFRWWWKSGSSLPWRWKRCLCFSLDSFLSIQVSFTHSAPPLYLPSTFLSSPIAIQTLTQLSDPNLHGSVESSSPGDVR